VEVDNVNKAVRSDEGGEEGKVIKRDGRLGSSHHQRWRREKGRDIAWQEEGTTIDPID